MTDEVVDAIMALVQRVSDLEHNRHRLAELFPRVDGAYSNIANLADRVNQLESQVDANLAARVDKLVRAHVEIHEHPPAPAITPNPMVLNRQQLAERLQQAELERNGLREQTARLSLRVSAAEWARDDARGKNVRLLDNAARLIAQNEQVELERDHLAEVAERLTRDRDILHETNVQLREQLADLQTALVEMKPAAFVPWVTYPGKQLSAGDTLTFTAPHTGWYQFRPGAFAPVEIRTPDPSELHPLADGLSGWSVEECRHEDCHTKLDTVNQPARHHGWCSEHCPTCHPE